MNSHIEDFADLKLILRMLKYMIQEGELDDLLSFQDSLFHLLNRIEENGIATNETPIFIEKVNELRLGLSFIFQSIIDDDLDTALEMIDEVDKFAEKIKDFLN